MDEITMLNALKTDLGITTKAYDERRVQYLRAAKNEIYEGRRRKSEAIGYREDRVLQGKLRSPI